MRNLVTVYIILLTFHFTLFVPVHGQDIDPLARNRILGKSSELMTIKSTDNEYYQILYDYSGGLYFVYGENQGNTDGYDQMDIISGDFNGDYHDDIVSVYEGTDQSINLKITHFNPNYPSYLHWQNSTYLHFPAETFYKLDFVSPALLSLVSGNFDEDLQDEFILAFWDQKTENIKMIFYETDENLKLNEICTEFGPTLNPALRRDAMFEIACGNFDSDPQQEIVILLTYPTEGTQALEVQLYDCSKNCEIQYKTKTTLFNKPEHQAHMERLSLAVGNLNSNPYDEIVVGFQRMIYRWESYLDILKKKWKIYVRTRSYVLPFEVKPDLSAFVIRQEPLKQYDNEVKYSDGHSEPKDVHYAGKPICVTTGDLNTDGRDEILFDAVNNLRVYSCDEALKMSEVGPLRTTVANLYRDASRRNVIVADLDANTQSKRWYPEIIIADWGNSSNQRRFRVIVPTIENGIITNKTENTLNISYKLDHQTAMVAGDFNGDGIKLGTPTYYKVKDVTQPIIVLNAPPLHFDVINDTVYDVCSSFNQNKSQFYSKYLSSATNENMMRFNITQDWGLATNIGYEGNIMGVSVKARFETHYGENFTRTIDTSYTEIVKSSSDASTDDWIFASVLDYEIWEYPVMAEDKFQGNVAVVVPLFNPKTSRYQWFPSKLWPVGGYLTNHEHGNILSYNKYPKLEDNEMLAQKIKGEYGTFTSFTLDKNSSHDWELYFQDFLSVKADTMMKFGFELGASVSATLVYYGVHTIEVGINGYYEAGALKTHITNIFKEQGIKLHLAGVDRTLGEVQYTITPYAYWAKNGALVIDYAVDPKVSGPGETPTFWDVYYGTHPDLAFILPWKYDPEKGEKLQDEEKRFSTSEIVFHPKRPEKGDTLEINVRFHNFSLVNNQSNFNISFYLGNPDKGGLLIKDINGKEYVTVDMPVIARGTGFAKMKWVIPQDVPHYPRLYAVLDPENEIEEIHENNNKGFVVLPVEGIIQIPDITNMKIPTTYYLHQNYPNPFNPSTTIEFDLPKASEVTLKIFNILGEEVVTLVSDRLTAGNYSYEWFMTSGMASGVYLYRLEAGEYVETRKMLLMR